MKREKIKNSYTVAVAGNPNVGKSTLFNALTGLKQHTGNWPGKTVGNAKGNFESRKNSYTLVDIPGTYSLLAHSPEEEIARNFLLFEDCETVIAVCDATCLERNLNLVLQILEIHSNTIVCVNLMDEAERKGITVNLEKLSQKLGVPVVSTVARRKKSLKQLVSTLDNSVTKTNKNNFIINYPKEIENALEKVTTVLNKKIDNRLNHRWLALQLLNPDKNLMKEIETFYGFDLLSDFEIFKCVIDADTYLKNVGYDEGSLKDEIVAAVLSKAENIAESSVNKISGYSNRDRVLDKFFTSRITGHIVMLILLCGILWITVTGANYLSDGLSYIFLKLEILLKSGMEYFKFTDSIQKIIIEGFYRVPTWVISVMLPPMAIFFPLFTLLEDAGYLPRIAFNLDKPFKKCNSCGKQALTMCMGFGCNAVGVTGCRIIDSKRERLLAVITNSFVPCNGKFPTIIALISMFFVTANSVLDSVISALYLTGVILLGIILTFLTTKFLSVTLLKGESSAYTLEMPPYRKPQIVKVVIRSVFDRTIFVLGRSVVVAIPAGIVIFIMANITVGDITLLKIISNFLDPFAKVLGLDGIILLAFILGFPANEIVVPIILMGYLSQGNLTQIPDLAQMKTIFINNDWTVNTALCTMIFSLLHWPCSTTVLTIKKETGSLKWTAVSLILPTVLGMVICSLITFIYNFLV